MMSHVTIQPAADNVPKSFLHSTEALLLPSRFSSKVGMSLDEVVDILGKNLLQMVKCGCSAHNMMEEPRADGESFDFCLLLSILQKLDLRDKLKDQSGAFCITHLFNFVCKRS